MKNIVIFSLFVFLAIFNYAESQIRPDSVQLAAFSNIQQQMGVNWNEKTGTPDIIMLAKPYSFASDPVASAKLFLNSIKDILRKHEPNDDLVLQRINENDDIQYLRFDQFYKNIPVLEGEYLVTVLPDGKVQCALGKYHKNISIDVNPAINLKEAFASAIQNSPTNIILKDTLVSSRLIIYPKDSLYLLAWELNIPSSQRGDVWLYIIDALNGTIIKRRSTLINETYASMLPQSQANVYLHHPYIDGSYTHVSPINDDHSGYLSGTYANVVNDATSRAFNSGLNFAYSTSDTHFDEANLFYQIDNFRRNFWQNIGFSSFTQMTAHAHTYFSGGPNADYNPYSHQLEFSDGQGVTGFNSFAREDKVIMHEYTHAVTDYISHIIEEDAESGAINEGNSDYYAGTFTGRTLICEYCCVGYPIDQRNMASPRIVDYTHYLDPATYTYYGFEYLEPHLGSELWSRSLWDLRSNSYIGINVTDFLVYEGLYGIPTTSTFLQYRQAIMNADITYYSGLHIKYIAHSFYLRGIGPDSLGLGITGPDYLTFKQQGTWSANSTSSSGNISYQWYVSTNSGSTWMALGTAQTQGRTMTSSDFIMRCDVHDNGTGENASTTHYVHYGTPPPQSHLLNGILVSNGSDIPNQYSIGNHPNPFNPSTVINYQLPVNGFIKLSVFDALGRELLVLVKGEKPAGFYSCTFDGSRLSSGLYFAHISVTTSTGAPFVQTIKMLLTK